MESGRALQLLEEKAPLRRYDLVTNYRCGGCIDEMERSEDGEWVRFEDVEKVLAYAAEVVDRGAKQPRPHE